MCGSNYSAKILPVPQDYIDNLRPFDERAQWAAVRYAVPRIRRSARQNGTTPPDFVTAVPSGSQPVPGCARAGRFIVTPPGHSESFDIYYKYWHKRLRRLPNSVSLNRGINRRFSSETVPGDHCVRCDQNWVEVGVEDESTGELLCNLPYKVFDRHSGQELVSGRLDSRGQSQRHEINSTSRELFVLFGTDAAINAAGQRAIEDELWANRLETWHGFPSGLTQSEFNEAFDDRHWHESEEGVVSVTFEPLSSGYASAGASIYNDWVDFVEAAGDPQYANILSYRRNRNQAFLEYQLATGVRRASESESFFAGTGPGLLFHFEDEIFSRLDEWLGGQNYDDAVAERRQLQRQYEISHGWYYVAGELTGMIPTSLIPVVSSSRVSRSATIGQRLLRAGEAGAIFGAISGAGADTGSPHERIDGIFLGAITGGVGAALLAGAGVLVVGGLSRTRIVGRVRDLIRGTGRRGPQPSTSNPGSRHADPDYDNLGGEFLDDDLRLPGSIEEFSTANLRLGTTRARNLEEQLILDTVARNPGAGQHLPNMTDRVPFGGFEKYSQVVQLRRSIVHRRRPQRPSSPLVGIDSVEVHYLWNRATGEITDLKILLPGGRSYSH